MSVENPVAEQDGDSGKVNGSKNEHVNGVHNGYSSSSEKHKSSHKSSSKDKHRDKDRDHKSSKHSSSSSRDKDRHSSSKSHSSSHNDRDKHSSSKDKHSSSSSSVKKEIKEEEESKVKIEEVDPLSDPNIKDEPMQIDEPLQEVKKEDSDDGFGGMNTTASSCDYSLSQFKDEPLADLPDDSEEDAPLRGGRAIGKLLVSAHDGTRYEHAASSCDYSLSQFKDEPLADLPDDSEEDAPLRGGRAIGKLLVSAHDGTRYEHAASSCDYSLSQFKDEPLADLPDDSEEDAPLVSCLCLHTMVRGMNTRRRPATTRCRSARRQRGGRAIGKLLVSAHDGTRYEHAASSCDYSLSQFKDEPLADLPDDSEEDAPLFKDEPLADLPDDSEEDAPLAENIKTESKASIKTENASPTKRKGKKLEEEQEVWKWWEEKKEDDGTKWKFLEHKGPVFAPPYEPLPQDVKFRYDGKVVRLSQDAEEVAGFYARMLDHDYTTKPVFNNNFFADWRKVMTHDEQKLIKDLSKCDFKEMQAYFASVSEKNKNRTKEEKAEIKAKNEEITKEYGFCIIDGHKEKIGNFRIEPPGLFRGRGEHPKMGMLKRRVMPEDVLINCSKDSKIPKAPPGHKWKEVRHDNTVTWLASWTENVQGQSKYVMLNPSSKLKGEKDWQKYETARKLHKCIDKIRDTYRQDWKAKEMRVRQRAVALYFIDRLALRAGNEKDDDQADTVGCCSLRVEHIDLHKEKDGKEYVVVFDFLGKDSIRYYNEVPVEKRVFKNLELFMENKKDNDDLFDRLNTQTLNEHLKDLMPGLTAKVFRTYNASITLQRQLDELTDEDASIPEKILAYNRANRAVAVLCNHQRAVPKGHSKSMEALKEKIQAKRDAVDEAEADLADARKQAKRGSVKEKMNADKKAKALERLREQLKKLELEETNRDENKTIALGTSKLNYLDPRISVAWCKKHNVPIEKIYNKTQRDKFRWAIDMAGPDYVF
ncbi:eukaryotic DNA topoisomerase i, catalytic core domain-containing protein [Phthorimaea operculella]|nr:eukaryotic DNA topoisomerase i, catalytic core domain-containing protein [Phthorimaea operculella]